jgi:myo-inositol-1-phosphate synthase
VIKIAIVGIGNCASSLIQGIHYYRGKNAEDVIGLMHWEIEGYKPGDIEVVAAYDVDRRKVEKDVHEAVFAEPNCTKAIYPDLPRSGVTVRMGRILDGVAGHMRNYDDKFTFVLADKPEATKEEVVKVNNIPVFIASDPEWAKRFEEKNIPIIGDDIKSQMGATIIHRVLTDLFKKRGVKLERTYQLNTGGNTDFLNMLSRKRLISKKVSKTEAVQAMTAKRLNDENIHIGPSDHVAWQKDNKICFIRMEGKLFGDVPMNLELRLSVEDSPNSAGVAIDAIRCTKLALNRGQGGALYAPSAYFCKHPPRQFTDSEAFQMIEQFINGE